MGRSSATSVIYNGKEIDCLDRLREIVDRIKSIEQVVVVPYVRGATISRIRNAVAWNDFGQKAQPDFVRLPFNEQVYILYSAGTTGLA